MPILTVNFNREVWAEELINDLAAVRGIYKATWQSFAKLCGKASRLPRNTNQSRIRKTLCRVISLLRTFVLQTDGYRTAQPEGPIKYAVESVAERHLRCTEILPPSMPSASKESGNCILNLSPIPLPFLAPLLADMRQKRNYILS
jgi:hypothetical protein